MFKIIKYGLYSVVGFLVLIVLLIIVALFLVDPNAYKGQIEKIVQNETKREFSIEGDIQWSFFPWIGIEMEALKLGNPKSFQQTYFAQANRANVKLKLLPLLHKQIHIGTFELIDLELNLIKDKQGKTNWQDLVAQAEKDKKKRSEQAEKLPTTKPISSIEKLGITTLKVDKFRVKDSTIAWTDKSSDTSLHLQKCNLSTGAISLQETFPFELSFDLSSKRPSFQGSITCSSKTTLDLQKGTINLQDFVLDSNWKGESILGKKASLLLKANADLNLNQQTINLDKIELQTYNISMNGAIQGSNILKKPKLTGSFNIDTFSPRQLIKELGLKAPNTADKEALTKAKAEFKLQASPNIIKIKDMKSSLDQSNMQGNIQISEFKSPYISFDMQLDKIDMDQYLPSEQTKKEVNTSNSKAQKKDEEIEQTAILPASTLELLRSVKIKGRLSIEELKMKNIKLNNVLFKLNAQNGIFDINPLKADLYKGNFQCVSTMRLNKEKPRIITQGSLKSVALEPLLYDISGKRTLSGTGNIDIDLKTNGMYLKELKQNANGQISLLFEQGSFRGINFVQFLRDTVQLVKGGSATSEPKEAQQTDFTQINAKTTINNGIAYTSDLSVASPLFTLQGSGQTDLVKEILNYTLQIKLAENISKHVDFRVKELKGQEIPVRISGTWEKPKYNVDIQSIITEMGEKKLKEEITERLNKLTDKQKTEKSEQEKQELKDLPGKLLKDLLN